MALRRGGKGPKAFVQQDVVDPTFADLGCRILPLKVAVEKVVRRAERRDRRIVSWSEYDLDVVRTLGEDHPDLVARFESRYANARSFAERWRNGVHEGSKPADGSLAGYLALIDYPLPDEAAAGRVGETVRIMRRRLESGLALTARQKERWDQLLEHNRHDCVGMRRVCTRAARELDAAKGGRSRRRPGRAQPQG